MPLKPLGTHLDPPGSTSALSDRPQSELHIQLSCWAASGLQGLCKDQLLVDHLGLCFSPAGPFPSSAQHKYRMSRPVHPSNTEAASGNLLVIKSVLNNLFMGWEMQTGQDCVWLVLEFGPGFIDSPPLFKDDVLIVKMAVLIAEMAKWSHLIKEGTIITLIKDWKFFTRLILLKVDTSELLI